MKKSISVWSSLSFLIACFLMFSETSTAQSNGTTTLPDTPTRVQAAKDLLTLKQIKSLVDIADESAPSDDPNARTNPNDDNGSRTSDDTRPGEFGFGSTDPTKPDAAVDSRTAVKKIQNYIDNANITDNRSRGDGDDSGPAEPTNDSKTKTSGADSAMSFGFADMESDDADQVRKMTLNQIAAMLDNANLTDNQPRTDDGDRSAETDATPSDDPKRDGSGADDFAVVEAAITKNHDFTEQEKVKLLQLILKDETSRLDRMAKMPRKNNNRK